MSNKTFEDIKNVDENGVEFWYARELQEMLQYNKWENFVKVIEIAKVACKISHHNVLDHFPEVRKMVDIGSKTRREIIDYELTRYACYLIVMNGDPRKDVIAHGQTYFAIKTRQQEYQELYDKLSEDERRLFLRCDIKQKNLLLAEAAKRAGISEPIDYAKFQDFGYMGLYGGFKAREIAQRKGITKKENILDYMGSAELGANIFRITQTEELMNKNNITTQIAANETHYKVGTTVRKAIKEIGGTMPEHLPTPEKSIPELEKEKRRQIKSKKSYLQ